MDSFDMSTDGDVAVRRLRFRFVRLTPEVLDPGQHVLMAARTTGGNNIVTFPCKLQWSVDGVLWTDVEFVNGSLLKE